MLPALVVGVGLVYFFLRDQKAKYPHDMYDCATGEKYVAETEADHQRMADLGYVHKMSECSIDPTLPEDDEVEEYPDTIEEVWSNEDGLVKVWKIGRHIAGAYDYSFAIGNGSGTSFVRANSDRGTTTITATDGSRIKRVMVFATLQDAIDYVQKDDEDDGGSPMKPEDPTPPPPSNPRPSLPPMGGLQQLSPSFGGM